MRHHLKLLLALLVPLALLAAACGDDDSTSTASGSASETADEGATDEGDTDEGDTDEGDTAAEPPADGPAIQMGAQDFGESLILSEIYGQVLTDAGYEVEQVEVGGFRDVLVAAFENDEVNFSPEYAASMLEFLNDFAGEATSDVDETTDLLQEEISELDLVALEPSEAVDTNAFVVTGETSDELGLTAISDLAEVADEVTLGAPQDCETNPFCIPGLQNVYDIDLSANFTPLEPGLVATSLEEGAIDVGVLFSTDGRIAENDWVLLEDDEQMLAADNVVPVLSQELVDAYGDDLTSLVDSVSQALTTDALIELNRQYDIDKEDADVIAAGWIEENL